MSIPPVRDTDIQFSFERDNSYSGKITAKATYNGTGSIKKPILLSEEYQIPSSYHPKGFSRGCMLFCTTSLCVLGPVTINAGLETNSTLRIIAGISMSAIFVISTIFSCGLMIRGEMGIKKFEAHKIAELLPVLKEKAQTWITSEQGSLSPTGEEVIINRPVRDPTEQTGLLSV